MRYRIVWFLLLGLFGLNQLSAQTVVPSPDILATATALHLQATQTAETQPAPDGHSLTATRIIELATETAVANGVIITATPVPPSPSASIVEPSAQPSPTPTTQQDENSASNLDAFSQTVIAVGLLIGILAFFGFVAARILNRS